jgi:hypothetical protein
MAHSFRVSGVSRAALALQISALALVFEATLPAGAGGAGRQPHLDRAHGPAHQSDETRDRIGPVARLGAKALGGDDEYAVAADAPVGGMEEARAHLRGQRARAPDVEPQLHRAGHLVDVLPARTGGPNEPELQLILVEQ